MKGQLGTARWRPFTKGGCTSSQLSVCMVGIHDQEWSAISASFFINRPLIANCCKLQPVFDETWQQLWHLYYTEQTNRCIYKGMSTPHNQKLQRHMLWGFVSLPLHCLFNFLQRAEPLFCKHLPQLPSQPKFWTLGTFLTGKEPVAIPGHQVVVLCHSPQRLILFSNWNKILLFPPLMPSFCNRGTAVNGRSNSVF